MKQWIGCAAWIVLSIATLIASADLGVMTRFGPGPGFFLRGLSFVLLALALIQALTLVLGTRQAARMDSVTADHPEAVLDVSEEGEPGPTDARGLYRLVALTAAMFGYGLLLEPLGFLPATVLLAWSAMVLLRRNPLRSVVDAVIAIALAYLVFDWLLGVNLPHGVMAGLGL